MHDPIAFQKILNTHLASFQAKNPRFSIRAFSKKTGMSAGTLSLVLLGKRKVSRKLALKVTEKLLLDPLECSQLFPSLIDEAKLQSPDYLKWKADEFKMISEWYHFAILNLTETKGFKSDAAWIADRLNITENTALAAIDRLIRVGILKVSKSGRYQRSKLYSRTTDDVTDLALRKSHRQTLELAQNSLDRDGLQTRDFTWLTIPFDPTKMLAYKKLIRRFQDEALNLAQDDASSTEVYRLAVQLFPLTRLTSPKEHNL